MVWASVLTLLVFVTTTAAFVPPQHSTSTTSSSSLKALQVNDLKASEQSVYKFLSTLQSSAYSFRTIVVGGGGAILESTQVLGSVMKVNESLKTGDLLCTLATDDQSFELHVKLNKVGKICLVEKETPKKKMMRIIRMLQADGTSICSLILTDSSDDAASWFGSLKEEYGDEFEP